MGNTFNQLKIKTDNGKKRKPCTGNFGMHRAQEQWSTWHKPLYHHKKQEEQPGKVGVEKIQPDPEKGNGA
jgi:hypothetical protein